MGRLSFISRGVTPVFLVQKRIAIIKNGLRAGALIQKKLVIFTVIIECNDSFAVTKVLILCGPVLIVSPYAALTASHKALIVPVVRTYCQCWTCARRPLPQCQEDLMLKQVKRQKIWGFRTQRLTSIVKHAELKIILK